MVKKHAFTLVELLAVIVILGVLLLVAIPTVTNIIENSKQKTFLIDCKAYLQAAKYEVVMNDIKTTQYYNIKDLEIENEKSSYVGGVLYFDSDTDGTGEYFIYIYDKNTKYSLGKNIYEKLYVVKESEISEENLGEMSERFEDDVDQNFRDTGFINFSIGEYDFEYDIQNSKISEPIRSLELGEKVYIPYLYNDKNYACKAMSAIYSTSEEATLLDLTEYDQSSFKNFTNPNLESFSYMYNRFMGYNSKVHVRLFSVNDLYYFANFDKYGFTVELFEENKQRVAKLFSNDPEGFYRTEWKNSKVQRFISLGDYSDQDRCRVDGTIGTNLSAQCYYFNLNEVHFGGKPIIGQFNPNSNFRIIINYIVTIKEHEKYLLTEDEYNELETKLKAENKYANVCDSWIKMLKDGGLITS